MTLGSTLRDAREAARLSIESLSESTSLRIGLITEMENNNFTHCGGDTYARGHLRNIAAKVGIDPLVFIDLYNEEHSTEHRAIQELLTENNLMQVPRESKKISWKVPAGFSLVVLLTIGVFQIVISNRSGTTPATEIAQPSQSDTPSPSPTQSQSPTPVATATPPPIVSASTTPQTGPVSLTISATRGNSYIDVIVDGKRSMKGSLFQGDSKSFQGVKSVSIYLSNPAGLDLTLNGKPLAPLGGQNEEVRRTFR